MKNEEPLAPSKFVLRSQLQVDASPDLKKLLKQIALRENTTLKEVVLVALAEKYPELAPYVRAEIEPLQYNQRAD